MIILNLLPLHDYCLYLEWEFEGCNNFCFCCVLLTAHELGNISLVLVARFTFTGEKGKACEFHCKEERSAMGQGSEREGRCHCQ